MRHDKELWDDLGTNNIPSPSVQFCFSDRFQLRYAIEIDQWHDLSRIRHRSQFLIKANQICFGRRCAESYVGGLMRDMEPGCNITTLTMAALSCN